METACDSTREPRTLAAELAERLAAFRKTLLASGLDGAVLVAATDVFYFSGTRQNAALFVPAAGEPELCGRKSLARAQAESPLSRARAHPGSKELAGAVRGARRLGFTFDIAPVA